VAPRVHIIERVEDQVEPGEPLQIELFVFDIGMMGNQLDVGIELPSYLFRNERLWLLDVFLSEEKLTIQIAQVDGVKVDNVDFAEAGEDKVLQQLTADPARADKKNSRLEDEDVSLAGVTSVANSLPLWRAGM
jgi:hypothetical protein